MSWARMSWSRMSPYPRCRSIQARHNMLRDGRGGLNLRCLSVGTSTLGVGWALGGTGRQDQFLLLADWFRYRSVGSAPGGLPSGGSLRQVGCHLVGQLLAARLKW